MPTNPDPPITPDERRVNIVGLRPEIVSVRQDDHYTFHESGDMLAAVAVFRNELPTKYADFVRAQITYWRNSPLGGRESHVPPKSDLWPQDNDFIMNEIDTASSRQYASRQRDSGGSQMFCAQFGTELPDDSQFCRKCGQPLTPTATTTTSPAAQGAAVTPTVAAPSSATRSGSNFNFGTIAFAAFSLLSLVVCFVQGIVPIYIVESVIWGALAWYWHKKNPASQTANLIALLLAVAVAAGEGYSVGQTGYKNSYEAGRKAGFKTGWTEGSKAGWDGGELVGYANGILCAGGAQTACMEPSTNQLLR
jgi:hypothetical protein